MRRTLACFAAVLAAGCGSGGSPTDAASTGADLAMAGPDMAVGPDMAKPASMCTAAVEQLLEPVDMVSSGVVNTLSDTGGVKTLYVDATAGGIMPAKPHPRLYVNLGTATRVQVSDVGARTSTGWDLALKRVVLFTNDGDGGPGMGGSLSVNKPFEQVTAADAMGQSFTTESFVDADCNPMMDPIGEVLTSMSNWYDYDQQTNLVTPAPNTTWIIRGGTGKLYKLAIDSYYSLPDGTMGMEPASGHYKLRVAAL